MKTVRSTLLLCEQTSKLIKQLVVAYVIALQFAANGYGFAMLSQVLITGHKKTAFLLFHVLTSLEEEKKWEMSVP